MEHCGNGLPVAVGSVRLCQKKVLQMSRSLVKSSQPLKPPRELVQFFADPPLALNEKREEYEDLFAAIAAATKPGDAIAWLLVRDFTDLTWEIQRMKNLKRKLIQAAEELAVADLYAPEDRLFSHDKDVIVRDEACEIARKWASDPDARRDMGKRLAEYGDDAMNILLKAFTRDGIDVQYNHVDRRIAGYEQRRFTLMRTIEQYSDKLARRVEAVPSEIIEGQFTEAAE